MLDDKPLVKENPYIKGLHSITSYLSQEDGILSKNTTGNYHTGYYRPLINLTYTMDYKIWGMNPSGFRITNLTLHILTVYVFYQLIFLVGGSRGAAFWISLIFALHPVHTESVTWISSRNNILVTLFSLLSLSLYAKGWERRSYPLYFFSLVCFMGAIFSKEFGLMLVPTLFIYQRWVSQRKDFKQEIYSYVPFLLILTLYFLVRAHVIGSAIPAFRSIDFLQRLSFAPYVIALNLRLILLPYGLHSFIIHYPSSLLSWETLSGFTCIGLLSLCFLWARKRQPIICFALLSFILSLFPILHFVNTSSVTLISMRWLYFATVFIALFFVPLIRKGFHRIGHVTCIFSMIVVAYFGSYTYILSENLWQDEEKFFYQEVVNFKNDFYAGGLAESLFQKGRYGEAEKYFRIAIKGNPSEVENHISYSALLIETGRPRDALKLLDEAQALVVTHHNRGRWFNNKGMAYFRLGERHTALKYFLKAVLYDPEEASFWSNLGGAYGSVGDYENSLIALRKGLSLNETSIPLIKNLAVTYMKMNRHNEVISLLQPISLSDKLRDPEILTLINQARIKELDGIQGPSLPLKK